MGGVADTTGATPDRSVTTGGGIEGGGASVGAGMAGAVCAETVSRKAPHARTTRAARRKVPMNRRCLVRRAARSMAVGDAEAKSVAVMGLLRSTAL